MLVVKYRAYHAAVLPPMECDDFMMTFDAELALAGRLSAPNFAARWRFRASYLKCRHQ